MHKANHTHRQVHDTFRRLLGPCKNNDRHDRLLAMRVDGIPVGDRLVELRASDSTFYGTAENEGLAVARALADLGYDAEVANVHRADKPDIVIECVNGSRLFAEHTAVDRGEIALARHCEAATNEFTKTTGRDRALRALLASKYVIVQVSRRVAVLPSPVRLAKDVAEFIRSNGATDMLCHKVENTNDAIAAASTSITVRTLENTPHTVLFKPMGDWVPMEGIDAAILEAIERKRVKALGYPASCRPLLLVITIADERLLGSVVRPTVQQALQSLTKLDPFDAIIVELVSDKPVVVGNVQIRRASSLPLPSESGGTNAG